MILSAQDIRNKLKPHDSGWFNKVSNTNAILDTHYEEVPEADRVKFGNLALDAIVLIIKKSDPVRWKDLTRETLYTAYHEEILDCENFSGLYVELFKLYWAMDPQKQYEPALLRTIIDGEQGIHAVAGFYYKTKIDLLDPQIDQIIKHHKILAVA